MSNLLHSKECKLPCYLGITPGKTTLGQARTILENIGAKFSGSFTSSTEHANKYTYYMRIGSLDPSDQPQEKNRTTETIFQGVTLTSSSDLVEGVDIDVSTTELKDTFRKYWSMYFVKEILEYYGIPDQVSLEAVDPNMANLGRMLLIVYPKIGTVLEIYGNEEENSICSEPGYEAKYLRLHIVLIDKNSEMNLYTEGGVSQTDNLVWTPITEALGITNEEFYKERMAGSSVCFMPKGK